MLKRLAPLAALLVALAAIVPTPPAHADRAYTLCDPAKAKLCGSLVALYEFDEATNSARTSETGSAPFLEVGGENIPANTGASYHKTGSAALDPNTTTAKRLYIPRSASLGGEFSINLWVYVDSHTNGTQAYILSTTDSAGVIVGSNLSALMTATGDLSFRFYVKQAMTDTVTYVDGGSSGIGLDTWYLVSFGEYPSPTTSEPYQSTMWISMNGGTRYTQTIAYPAQVFLGDFQLGDSGGNADFIFDQLSVFSGTLSAGELTWLYNSGSGRAYPFTANP